MSRYSPTGSRHFSVSVKANDVQHAGSRHHERRLRSRNLLGPRARPTGGVTHVSGDFDLESVQMPAASFSRRTFIARGTAGLAALALPGVMARAARSAIGSTANIWRVGFVGAMNGLTPYTYNGYYGFFNVSG